MIKPSPLLRDPKYIAKEFFTYEINFTTALNAGANQNGYVTIDSDSDFFWTKATAFCTVANAGVLQSTEQVPVVDIVITNTTSGRSMMNTQVPVRNLFGTGLIPFILPIETYFGATSQLAVQVFNVSAATNYSTLKLSFIGIKAFAG